jgi:hypothetical protein
MTASSSMSMDSFCLDGDDDLCDESSVGSEDVCVICLEGFEKTANPCCAESSPTCEVVYETQSGDFTTIAFKDRPLGMVTVVNRLPVTVRVVVPGSPSEKLGVQEGWIIRGIDNASVVDMTFPEVFKRLQECSDCLPSQHVVCGECNSKFHGACIQNWVVKGTDTCPICRQDKLPASRQTSKEPLVSDAPVFITGAEAVIADVTGAWSSQIDMTDIPLTDVFPHGCVLTCLCPCIVAERIALTAQWPAAMHSRLSHFGFFLIGVFFGLAILSTFLLPFVGEHGDCTVATRFPTGLIFVQLSNEMQGKCARWEQVALLSARVSWCGFVAMLALYRLLLARRFGIHGITQGFKALLCQFCGCYSCTLAQEGRHAIKAYGIRSHGVITEQQPVSASSLERVVIPTTQVSPPQQEMFLARQVSPVLPELTIDEGEPDLEAFSLADLDPTSPWALTSMNSPCQALPEALDELV